jgi:lipopolysaccharide export system protein LptC
MNINSNGITVTGTGSFTTIDTGLGATEVHLMNQNVRTTDSVTFANITGSLSGNATTATTLQTARTINGTSFNGSANIVIPNLVSGSSQIVYGSISSIPAGIVSGSSQIVYGSISSIPAGIVSGSSQINADTITNFDANVLAYNNSLGVVSGSSQINADTITNFDANVLAYNNSLGVVSGSRVVTIGSTGITLGGTATTIAGLISVTSTGFTGSLSGNASTATTLQTARTINGTSFNGSGNITTSTWGTARTITIGSTGKSVDGSANVTWSLAEIGAPSLTGTGASGTWDINVTGTAVKVNGTSGQLIRKDDRIIEPNSIDATTMQFGFTTFNNDNGSPYADYLHFRSYGDGSGGDDNLLMFNKNALGIRLWQRQFGSTTAYSVYKDVAWTDGTNATGTWGISTTGNAGTATTLQTARTINGTSFNGSANIVIPNLVSGSSQIVYGSISSIPAGIVSGSSQIVYGSISSIPAGIVSGSSQINADTITNFDANVLAYNNSLGVVSGSRVVTIGSTAITLGGTATTIAGLISVTSTGFTGSLSGNATTATTLQTARTIGLSGVTATATSFNGSANITIPITAVSTSLLTGIIADAQISGSYTGMGNLTGTGTVDFNKFTGNASNTVTSPSFTFTSDPNTGMYNPSADQVGITTGGVNRLTISTTAISSSLPLSATTIDTGQGATEVHLMNQNVRTTDSVSFAGITETSALKYKENIFSIEDTLDTVLKLRPVKYNLKGGEKVEIGLIAEEVHELIPELIKYNSENEIDSISYTRLAAVLIGAIKEQQTQINKLKEQIEINKK